MVKVANILTSVDQTLNKPLIKSLISLIVFGKFTRIERCLILIVIISLITWIVSIFIIIISGQKSNICSTHVCINAASSIINQINESISPCDDFYQFACGGLDNEEVEIPEDRSTTWTAMNSSYDLTSELKKLLDKLNNDESVTDGFLASMRHYYNLCMDTETIERLQHSQLLEVLNQIGKWPVLIGSSWKEDEFDINDTMVDASRYGFDTGFFFRASLDQTIIRPNVYLKIGDCHLYLLQRYYTNGTQKDQEILSSYLSLMIEVVTILGADPVDAEEEMTKVLKLETDLAMAGIAHGQIKYVSVIPIALLQERVPIFDWLRYLQQIVVTSELMTNETRIIVESETYLLNISQIIEKTDKRTIANYIFWHLFSPLMDTINHRFTLIKTKFNQQFDGRRSYRRFRSDVCASMVSKMFSFGSSYLYSMSNSAAKQKLLDFTMMMTNYTRLAFDKLISSSTWMDIETTQRIINKSHAMKFILGYADELNNYTFIDSYYQWLPNDTDLSLTLMTLHLKFWHRQKTYQLLTHETIPMWQLLGSALTINAYYILTKNSVFLTMGIIETSGLDKDQPMYLNFGAIAWIIGHEISHSVDPNGKHYDESGTHSNWWSNLTSIDYSKRIDCFVKQFNQYTIRPTNLTINGRQTLSENIADNVGLRVAFMAYKFYIQDHGQDASLPGLTHYTAEQLFFIRSSRFYCGKWSKESIAYFHGGDVHSHSRVRAIGSVSNLHEFSYAFNCESGSKMNPTNKCVLW